jgi:hypothetical protein
MIFVHRQVWKSESDYWQYTYDEFKPPDATLANGPPPIEGIPPTVYNGGGKDYKSLCNLVDNAFTHLPDNWESLYLAGLVSSSSVVLRLGAHIEETRRELGLDFQDRCDGDVSRRQSPTCDGQAGAGEHDADAPLGQEEGHDGDLGE